MVLLFLFHSREPLTGAAMAKEPAAATIAASSYEVDLGNLMAYDPSHHRRRLQVVCLVRSFSAAALLLVFLTECGGVWLGAAKFREELRQECLRKGTELAQAVADALFALPPNEDRDGPIVHLPPPTVGLPREKHVRASLLISY
jgi:regulator of ribosome biosynthesis